MYLVQAPATWPRKEPPKRKEPLPEHGLVPVGLCSSCHVFSSQSAAHHGVVVVLHAPPAQFDVIKAGSIPCLGENHPVSPETGTASISAQTKNIGKRTSGTRNCFSGKPRTPPLPHPTPWTTQLPVSQHFSPILGKISQHEVRFPEESKSQRPPRDSYASE